LTALAAKKPKKPFRNEKRLSRISLLLVTSLQKRVLSIEVFYIEGLVTIRVTRLGEFSSIGRLFSLGNLQKEPKILRCFFPLEKAALIYFDQKGLGNCLGEFLTNSSGHPGHNPSPLKHFADTTTMYVPQLCIEKSPPS
jgi:hypothetical protein